MQQRLSIITLGVANLKTAQAFYDALGWKASSEEEGIVCYDLQSMALALYPLDKLEEDAKVPVVKSGYSSITIAHNVGSESEVDQTLAQAEKAGGEIIKPAEKVFWGGYSGYFSDPDQYLWEVAYNPHSVLGSNGEFQWKGF